MLAPYLGANDLRELFQGPGRARGLPFNVYRDPAFFELERKIGEAETSVILTIFPHTLVGAQMNHVMMSLFMPISTTQTRIRRRFSFVGDATTDPALTAQRQMIRDSWRLISEQDSSIVAQAQQLARQHGELALKPRFSPFWEPAMHHFQKMFVTRLSAA